MTSETFASVWDAIEDTSPEAENMKLRSALMMALEKQIHDHGWTPAEAARRLGVTQARVSDLMRGKIEEFGMDTLVNMAVAGGCTTTIQHGGSSRLCWSNGLMLAWRVRCPPRASAKFLMMNSPSSSPASTRTTCTLKSTPAPTSAASGINRNNKGGTLAALVVPAARLSAAPLSS